MFIQASGVALFIQMVRVPPLLHLRLLSLSPFLPLVGHLHRQQAVPLLLRGIVGHRGQSQTVLLVFLFSVVFVPLRQLPVSVLHPSLDSDLTRVEVEEHVSRLLFHYRHGAAVVSPPLRPLPRRLHLLGLQVVSILAAFVAVATLLLIDVDLPPIPVEENEEEGIEKEIQPPERNVLKSEVRLRLMDQ